MRYISPYMLMIKVNLEPVYGILLVCFYSEAKEKRDTVFYVAIWVMLSEIFFNQSGFKRSFVLKARKSVFYTNIQE